MNIDPSETMMIPLYALSFELLETFAQVSSVTHGPLGFFSLIFH